MIIYSFLLIAVLQTSQFGYTSVIVYHTRRLSTIIDSWLRCWPSVSPVTVLQGICDGAGAVVLASEAAVKEHSLTPLARLVGYAVAGVEPTIMGIGPAPAIRKLLEKSGLSLNDIALVEVGAGSRCVTHLTLYACFTFVIWQCFFTVLITIFCFGQRLSARRWYGFINHHNNICICLWDQMSFNTVSAI